MINMYRAGQGATEIAKQLGVDRAKVYRLLQEANISFKQKEKEFIQRIILSESETKSPFLSRLYRNLPYNILLFKNGLRGKRCPKKN